MPVWHQVFTILMIYALKTRKFVAALYAHFPQFFFDVKAESAKFFGIWGYSPLGHSTYVNSIPGKKLTFEAWQFCMGECQSKFWSLGFQTSCLFHSWHFSSLEVFFSVGGCHNCHIEGGSRNNWEMFFSITPVGKKTGFPSFSESESIFTEQCNGNRMRGRTLPRIPFFWRRKTKKLLMQA